MHVNKGKAHSGKKLLCFFGAPLFFAKNHYNGECLKILPSSNWQDGHKFFFGLFSEIRAATTKKCDKKSLWWHVADSEKPKNRIGKKYFRSPKFWPKNCPGVSSSDPHHFSISTYADYVIYFCVVTPPSINKRQKLSRAHLSWFMHCV